MHLVLSFQVQRIYYYINLAVIHTFGIIIVSSLDFRNQNCLPRSHLTKTEISSLSLVTSREWDES